MLAELELIIGKTVFTKSSRKYKLEDIRNIGVIAHIDAGKTTTTERMLYFSGRIYKIGTVDEGTATMDWMPEEQERGITITAAATTVNWNNKKINVIDTPGHVDFTVEVERSLKVLDGCVVVFCGVGGVEPQTETVWRQADRYEVPRLIFINKLDRVGSDFFAVIDQAHHRLTKHIAAIQIPFGKEENFKGNIDLVSGQLITYTDELGSNLDISPIPEDLQAEYVHHRNILIEKLAEVDDHIMAKFAHSEPVSNEEIKTAIRSSVIKSKFIPALCGSSLRNKGIQLLLDAVCDYLPSPLDIPAIKGLEPKSGEYEERLANDRSPMCGLCFKIATDPYVGRLNYVRIYSGILKSGTYIYNATQRCRERVSKIVQMHANKQEIVEELVTGDIGAIVGLKETRSGDTLCDESAPIILESIHFPEPVISMAIEPKSKVDQDRLGMSLKKLEEEDPSLRVTYNSETGETIISGMGQLHLEIAINRLLREFNVGAEVGRPQVAYKETITKKVSSVGKFIQQTGGRGQYGHVVIEMSPAENKGTGITFIDKIRSGAIPKEFISSVKNGIFRSSKSGCLSGFPVTDVDVKLVDGSYHEVDSSEIAFQMAAAIAFTEGMKKAAPVLLEPIMDVEVMTPFEYMGQVISDLNSRRGKVISLGQRGNVRTIRADVPLAELFEYANSLRSLTQGRASYTMEPSYYQEVPSNIREKIVSVSVARF
jgi:elongation factor G